MKLIKKNRIHPLVRSTCDCRKSACVPLLAPGKWWRAVTCDVQLMHDNKNTLRVTLSFARRLSLRSLTADVVCKIYELVLFNDWVFVRCVINSHGGPNVKRDCECAKYKEVICRCLLFFSTTLLFSTFFFSLWNRTKQWPQTWAALK